VPAINDPFSAELRRRTQRAHRLAEQARFIRGFLRGTVTRSAYLGLLQRLHAVYQALEIALRHHAGHPACGPFWWPELARTEALQADLRALGGSPLSNAASPATERFCAHLERCAAGDPVLLVAHAYVRYLGDLSGGQVLHRLALRSLDLVVDQQDHFYSFPGLPDITVAKADFRHRLDQLGDALPERREDLVNEAILSFQLNLALFEELEAAPWRRWWRAFVAREQGS